MNTNDTHKNEVVVIVVSSDATLINLRCTKGAARYRSSLSLYVSLNNEALLLRFPGTA